MIYANVLYQFIWHEFCDWYIEMSKLALHGAIGNDSDGARKRLSELLDQILLLLHPVMPFVTEEIWQVMGNGRPSIMVQQYPITQPQWIDGEAEKQMEFLMGVVRAIRNLRTELNCPPGKGSQSDLLRPAGRSGFPPRPRALLALAGARGHSGISRRRRSLPKAPPPQSSALRRYICPSTI